MVPLSFAGDKYYLTSSNALFWPRERALLVADLHLEKGSFFARHGQMIPPYDSQETLQKIADALQETGAERVVCLGDSFHDSNGVERLETAAVKILQDMTCSAQWYWITGNHDPDMKNDFGGIIKTEMVLSGIILRHEAKIGESRPEISGHFHPRLHITVRQRRIRRNCIVMGHSNNGGDRMIIPAFGAYTGGLDAAHPAILAALQPADTIEAIVRAGADIARFPLNTKFTPT